VRRTASAIRLALWFPLAVVVSGLPITAGLGHRDTEGYSARVGTRRVGHSTAAAVPLPLRCAPLPVQRLTFSCFRMSHVSDACGC
jgi:hypothetical protein